MGDAEWNRITVRHDAPMSTPIEQWKKWGGKIVDGKLPLKQWLGGSDHSAVFLTERTSTQARRAVIKLIPAQNLNEEAQLSRWASAARLSHPHVIRLFEYGRCAIEGTRLLYFVMEYAEENLAEILPVRALSAAEASEMLPPVADALAYLHKGGYAHGRIKPSNIMAVENQLKISADGVGKIGAADATRASGPYDAPEIGTTGPAPAADIWALGGTLAAVMTQNEAAPKSKDGRVVVPDTIPPPLHQIVRDCLQADPKKRCTLNNIVERIQPPAPAMAERSEAREPKPRAGRRMFAPIILVPILAVAIFLIALLGSRFFGHKSAAPESAVPESSASAEGREVVPQAQPARETPATQTPAVAARAAAPAVRATPSGTTSHDSRSSGATSSGATPSDTTSSGTTSRGSVAQKVMPNVSHGAQSTIRGHVKVSVQVAVDAAGNVSQAKLVLAGPSKYFSSRALEAARGWKFTPPQVKGQGAPSEWILRFQFGRTGTQVFPSQTNP
jgi:TonB family protein